MYVLSYQWGFVVSVKDIDEVSNCQHTCRRTRAKQASISQHNFIFYVKKRGFASQQMYEIYKNI